MQSSFRSRNRPEPINLLLRVGTDNVLGRSWQNNAGEASPRAPGLRSGAQTGHHLCSQAETRTHKYVVVRKTRRDVSNSTFLKFQHNKSDVMIQIFSFFTFDNRRRGPSVSKHQLLPLVCVWGYDNRDSSRRVEVRRGVEDGPWTSLTNTQPLKDVRLSTLFSMKRSDSAVTHCHPHSLLFLLPLIYF